MSTYWKITLFSNQRDPIRKWKAKSRSEALERIVDDAGLEMVDREKMGQFFTGEVVQLRIEHVQE